MAFKRLSGYELKKNKHSSAYLSTFRMQTVSVRMLSDGIASMAVFRVPASRIQRNSNK